MIWSSVKLFFVFLLGFLCSKAFDMFFQIEDLIKILEGGGISLTNEKKVELRGETSHAEVEQANETSAPQVVVDPSPTISEETTAEIAVNPPPAAFSPPESGFASIVDTAYKRGLQPKIWPAPRKVFDVNWWETKSGLTTEGGLKHHDRFLLGQIYGNASSVFEFGLGESTYIANYVGVPRYSGIDSDPAWVGMARDKVAPHFRFYLGDIGKTREWGYPRSAGNQKNILNYQLSPLIVEPQPFDVYMIDGRWRLPSLIASFLHASDRGAPHSETTCLIHDCGRTHNSGRTGYKRADHLLDLVRHSGAQLCVYKRKPATTDEQLKDLWHKYMNEIERR